ncbi:MAG: hypothetical protein HQK83_09320 [Fibrobacteria bacterium]|nr:hypothetical protein [Fibrobacteria bacterium]
MNFLGIDVGTQGARTVICNETGKVIALADCTFPPSHKSAMSNGWFEQQPADWWKAVVKTLQEVTASLKEKHFSSESIKGISVTSTSGTVCTIDGSQQVLGPAIMYNDKRSEKEAIEVQAVGAELAQKLGYRFSASFALPKLLWLLRHEQELFHKARYLLSPTDFIIGKLTGEFGFTDYSNALKTGYDLIEDRWPEFIETKLGIPLKKLPCVTAPGKEIALINRQVAAETGLDAGTRVYAGMTDSCASQVSTGAIGPGNWCSTLGTTLVIKGVTKHLIKDPQGRIYCHRHPDGYWLPGGSSNTGGECISTFFENSKLETLNRQAMTLIPTGILTYPLIKSGERFPFVQPRAKGFLPDPGLDEAIRYTACLEGVGYIERLSYQLLESLGAEIGDFIFTAGGANKATTWLQIRADILQKTLLIPRLSGGAMGAAIIAAAGSAFKGIVPAAKAMVQIEKEILPRKETSDVYSDSYNHFCEILRQHGYLSE